MDDQPFFQHSCTDSACTYLGRYTSVVPCYVGMYDLYVCKAGAKPLYIARHGDELEQCVFYTPGQPIDGLHPCYEARKRAETRGLV